MALGVIFAAVFIVLILVGLIAARKFRQNGSSAMSKAAVIFAVAMLLGLIVVPFSFHTVDTGEIAVVKHLGEAKNTRSAGTHFDLWVTNSYQVYDAKVQNVDIDTATYSSDAQTMNIQMTLQYQIMSEKVMEIAKHYGSLEVLQSRIQSIAIEKTKAVLSAYKAMNIISNRAAMSPAVEQAIKDAVGEEFFVNITAVVLTNIDFSDAFEQAVEEKMIAEQQQLKAEYENQTNVARAEAEANAKLIAANAEADAKVIAAKAESEANELLQKSLTDMILREMYLEKWDGKLPKVFTGGDPATIMIPAEPDGE